MTTKTNIIDSVNPAIPSLRMNDYYLNVTNWQEITPLESPSGGWVSFAASDDGQYQWLVNMIESVGLLVTSNDGGESWGYSTLFTSTGKTYGYTIGISSDGDTVLVGESRLWRSTNYGSTWTELRPAGDVDGYWFYSKISQNGNVMYVLNMTPSIVLWKSTNGGDDWTELTVPYNSPNFIVFDINSDGATIVIWNPTALDRLYISNNYGTSWSELQPVGDIDTVWRGAAISSDGTTIIACENGIDDSGGRTWISTNSGVSWDELRPFGDTNITYDNPQISDDGEKIIIQKYDSDLEWVTPKITFNYGETWHVLTSTGHAVNSNAPMTTLIANNFYSVDDHTLYEQILTYTGKEGDPGRALLDDIVAYLSPIHKRNVNTEAQLIKIPSGGSFDGTSYDGAVYSPTQNRIYFVPGIQAYQQYWHYIDCNTGEITAYANTHYGLETNPTSTGAAYLGGAYSPTQNRIYFIPTKYQIVESYWHYIDCNTGSVIAYAHGISSDEFNTVLLFHPYHACVYSPTQNRIYFVPFTQVEKTNWHYIDCNTGNIVAYAHGTTNIDCGYCGGCYSPTQNRIYMTPAPLWYPVEVWQYIDCTSTGQIVTENFNGSLAPTLPYAGAVYSPTQNRIYFVPFGQAEEENWHYIDCNTGEVVAYIVNSTQLDTYYYEGAYSPTQNKIYLFPRGTEDPRNTNYLQYIDCNATISTNIIVDYYNPMAIPTEYYSFGGVYSPTQNRIYFGNFDTDGYLYYVQEYSNEKVSRQLMSNSALFNKF